MPTYSEFGRKVFSEPDIARAEFLEAFQRVRGRRTPPAKPGPSLLKELGCTSFSVLYRWVDVLGIDLAALDAAGEAMGWEPRRSGGAGFHKDKAARAAKAAATMAERGIRPGRKKKLSPTNVP